MAHPLPDIPELTDTSSVPDGEMSSYFPSMLDDADRNRKYELAIRRCVADFRDANEGRTPLVLDVGCGTGLLSVFALSAGARVLAVDANPMQVEASRETLSRVDVPSDMWKVVPVSSVGDELGEGVDIIVSELMGTLVDGEDMYRILKLYEPCLNTCRGGPYVVPRRLTQTFRAVRLQGLNPVALSCLNATLKECAEEGLYVPSNALDLHPALYFEGDQLGPTIEFYEQDYSGGEFSQRSVAAETMKVDVTGDGVCGVLEWKAELWSGVELRNTLEEYRSLPLRNAMSREGNWGFMLCHLPSGRTSVHGLRGERMRASVGIGNRKTFEKYRCEDVATDSSGEVRSMAALLDEDALLSTTEALDAARGEVLLFGDGSAFEAHVEAECSRRGLPEPWVQPEMARAWSVSAVEEEFELEEEEEGGEDTATATTVLLQPHKEADRVSEAVAKWNDDRYDWSCADVRRCVASHFGLKVEDDDDLAELEWRKYYLPTCPDLPSARAVAHATTEQMAGVLKEYAAHTRRGVLPDEMPGLMWQALPLACKREPTGEHDVPVFVAMPDSVPLVEADAPVSSLAARDARRCAAALCHVGCGVRF